MTKPRKRPERDGRKSNYKRVNRTLTVFRNGKLCFNRDKVTKTALELEVVRENIREIPLVVNELAKSMKLI